MEIKINVDETMFKEVLEKELNAFGKDELHEILKECIISFFKNNDNIQNLFLNEEYETWGYGSKTERHLKGYEPTGLLKSIVSKFDYKEPYDEVKQNLLDYASKDDNLKKILKELISESFKNAFVNELWQNQEVRSGIASIFDEAIWKRENNS